MGTSKSASTAGGRNAVTARSTGVAIHHHDIQISRPMLPRTAYGAEASGSSSNARKTTGPPSA